MKAAAKVVHVRLSDIRPCPENNDVYGGLSLSDPDVADLLASIRANGLMEPIRISADGYVISGHRVASARSWRGWRRFQSSATRSPTLAIVKRSCASWSRPIRSGRKPPACCSRKRS